MTLAKILDRYPPGERPEAEPTPLGSAGGLSGSRLWRYPAPNGLRVLRAWPPGTTIGRATQVHGWLRSTAGLPFVPRPIATTSGATAIEAGGLCWELAPWLPGRATAGIPTSPRVRAGFAGMADLHLRLAWTGVHMGPSPGLNARRDEVRALIATGFDSLATALTARASDSFASDALVWLGLARRLAPGVLASATAAAGLDLPLQPSLRDARPEHLLFTGDELTGLVDFGAMDVESPAADLARLSGEWLPRGTCEPLRADALAAYATVRPISPAEAMAAAAFEDLADLLIAERWTRWRFLEDRRFEEGAFAAGIERGLSRLRGLGAR